MKSDKRMPYKIHIHTEREFIEVVYSGPVTPDEVLEVDSKTIKLERKNVPNLYLSDFLNANLTFSILDLYNKPSTWTKRGFNPLNKLAIISTNFGKQWEDLKFFETTSLNQGLNVKIFSNREDALDWLLE